MRVWLRQTLGLVENAEKENVEKRKRKLPYKDIFFFFFRRFPFRSFPFWRFPLTPTVPVVAQTKNRSLLRAILYHENYLFSDFLSLIENSSASSQTVETISTSSSRQLYFLQKFPTEKSIRPRFT
jgi:hypothetical protein